jgi:hypothetical protein
MSGLERRASYWKVWSPEKSARDATGAAVATNTLSQAFITS